MNREFSNTGKSLGACAKSSGRGCLAPAQEVEKEQLLEAGSVCETQLRATKAVSHLNVALKIMGDVSRRRNFLREPPVVPAPERGGPGMCTWQQVT